jgi:hypothetical protein
MCLCLCACNAIGFALAQNSAPTPIPDESDSIPSKAECVENSKIIRNFMRLISNQGKVAPDIIHQLEIAAKRNQISFESLKNHPLNRAFLFGAGAYEEMEEDYSIFRKSVQILRKNAGDHADAASFAAIVHIAGSLSPIVQDNAEWAEYLEALIGDLALAAPKALVKHLANSSADEFDKVMGGLVVLCETDQYKKLRADLYRLRGVKQYARIIEKIINELNRFDPSCSVGSDP